MSRNNGSDPIAGRPLPERPASSFPFRVGVPSYVYPADILPNVRVLAPRLDHVELSAFETDDLYPLPSPNDVREMADLAETHGITYSVHLPMNHNLASEDPAERQALADGIAVIAERFAPLDLTHAVLHVQGVRAENEDEPKRLAEILPPLFDRIGGFFGNPARVAVENIDSPFSLVAPHVYNAGFSVCADLGHLPTTGDDTEAFLDKHVERIRAVHLYGGETEGRCHRPLADLPDTEREIAYNFLRSFKGVVILELFSPEAIADSLACLNHTWPA